MKIIKYCVDLLFPPSEKALQIRALTPEQLYTRCKEASPCIFPFIESVFSYKDPLIKDLIWELKYKKNSHAFLLCGRILQKKILSIYAQQDHTRPLTPPLLIPIPLSKKKRKLRGYNQCELLINEIIKHPNLSWCTPCCDVLMKIQHTESQSHTTHREERLINIRGSFAVVHQEKIFNKDIILIDDVTTTGATLMEAKNILEQNGARNVVAVTIAH